MLHIKNMKMWWEFRGEWNAWNEFAFCILDIRKWKRNNSEAQKLNHEKLSGEEHSPSVSDLLCT